jgi:tetratricopeptide (TPR) repeat protein
VDIPVGLLDRFKSRSQSSGGVSVETTFMTAVQMIRQGPGYYHRAEDLLLRVVRATPNFVEAYDQLAELYYQMDRKEDAIGMYLSLLRVNERNARAHYDLGVLYVATGRTSEAARHFRRSIDLSPQEWAPIYNLGACHMQSGDYREAVSLFRTALQMNPRSEEAQLGLSVARNALGDKKVALECDALLESLGGRIRVSGIEKMQE